MDQVTLQEQTSPHISVVHNNEVYVLLTILVITGQGQFCSCSLPSRTQDNGAAGLWNVVAAGEKSLKSALHSRA